MIKAIFFDIDGTLVSFKTHQMPESAISALRELQRKGILIFIATGRDKDGLDAVSKITFDGYITLNGQYDFVKDKVIYENFMTREDLKTLLEEERKDPFPCGFTMPDRKVFNFRDWRVDAINDITHNDDHPAGDVSHIMDEKVYQVMAFIDEEKEKKLMRQLPHCVSGRWHSYFTDISPEGGTKQLGIDKMSDYFGIKKDETMAFGDGGNDEAMLKHCAHSVAMGNATDRLKSIADYVTDDVDNDGLAKALRHYHLI